MPKVIKAGRKALRASILPVKMKVFFVVEGRLLKPLVAA